MIRYFWLLVLFLTGCVALTPEPTSSWQPAHWREHPGIVSLATGWGKSQLCTGVVLSSQTVLSAAHCVLSAQDTYVVYGCDDITQDKCIRVPVVKIISHPEYQMTFESGNDLALFQTKVKINLQPIKIASENYYAGDTIKAVGFGKRNAGSGVMYSGFGIIKNEYRYEFEALLKEKMDPNPGDSGGPALVFENGEYQLLGILSRVKMNKTLEPGVYSNSGRGIYTRIKTYEKWIRQEI